SILAVYSMILGGRLVMIAFRKKIVLKKVKNIGGLGFIGGFLYAFSGGGWGPIVTSTLLSNGRRSKFVVGTVSLSEFFVTLSSSIVFFSVLGVSHWYVILGLIVGGAIAAPLAARLAGKLPQKTALIFVAILVITFSIRMLMKVLA
ncbi:MAG: TSUP family transporter, partial [Thermoflexibacteraceae bacterium]